MRKVNILSLLLLTPLFAQGQTITFDDLPLPGPNTDYTQTIDTGNYFFSVDSWTENKFYGRKESWGGYSGFTYSNVKDSVTEGSANDKAAFPAIGAQGTEQYAIAYGSNYGMHVDLYIGVKPTEYAHVWNMYITNSTYAVRSMENGDDFAKKFGGEDGTDPDWFLLTIKGYNFSDASVDSVEFYLADFRSEDPSEDYIVKDWRFVSLESLGAIDSLSFSLSSSDNGEFGMNTPAYFCIDQVDVEFVGSITDKYKDLDAAIYPNPVADMLYIRSDDPVNIKIADISGKVVLSAPSSQYIDVSNLQPGVYLVSLSDKTEEAFSFLKLIKK